MIRDLIIENRTCRRFKQEVSIDLEVLRELVDLTRFTASGSNLQPLRYMLSNESRKNDLIFPTLGWAGQIADWPGPAEGERPSAYIIMLADTKVNNRFCEVDAGLATQSIMLGAREKGLGGCMHWSVKRDDLRPALDIPVRYEILYVLSLGKPDEKIIIEKVGSDGKTSYWHDEEGAHHVPKRELDDIIIG
ncbi:MAG: nitroreductase family protein [Dehalococcoidales bacterium]|nr:MAG: nitroreductase family protein [Dehalococcoidales bacterium]